MSGFGDRAIEDLLERVNPLTRDRVFVVHEMHREGWMLGTDDPMLASVDDNVGAVNIGRQN